MRKIAFPLLGAAAIFCFGFYSKSIITEESSNPINIQQTADNTATKPTKSNMKLGAFSVSLSVKDLKASKEFYEKMGFTAFGGGMEKNYLIMKNGNALIGLFQGMFQGNILTFNPGWDENAKNMESFDDVREIQRQLKSNGVAINPEADEKGSGPASFMTTDPDGNVILFDQHR